MSLPGWRVDFHSHTWHSLDSWMSPESLVARARAAGLDRIAVTDHGTIEGALEARAIDPERVIVGQEVCCAGGTELIGLFLSEPVPMGLPVSETRARIVAQGGIVYAPHPYAYGRRPRQHAKLALDAADFIEVFNSRAFLPHWNRSALRTARDRDMPGFAGSDAHFPWEIGRAHTLITPFANAAELRVAARSATPVGFRKANPFIHVASITLEYTRRTGRLLNRPLPGSIFQRPAER